MKGKNLEEILSNRTIRYIEKQLKELSGREVRRYLYSVRNYISKYQSELKMKRWKNLYKKH